MPVDVLRPIESEEWEWLDHREKLKVEEKERKELLRLLKKYGCPDYYEVPDVTKSD